LLFFEKSFYPAVFFFKFVIPSRDRYSDYLGIFVRLLFLLVLVILFLIDFLFNEIQV